MKYLSKILPEKYHQLIEKDIYLKSILREANNSFRNMKSIKNYIVRNRYQQGK